MLNAFRHQRFLHLRSRRRVSAAKRCRCSTPFGINDSCTTLGRCPDFRLIVLNAFRHQRFLHPHISQGSVFSLCAQRLSASTIPALGGSSRLRAADRVLNAFRHQRFLHWCGLQSHEAPGSGCSTPFGINDSCTFRLREMDDQAVVCSTPFGINDSCTLSIVLPSPPTSVCSTPFGINDSCTRRPRGRRGVDRAVLNAFRHQRFLHGPPPVSGEVSPVCSTPFGINDSCTITATGQLFALAGVLNAFRHQRFLHLSPAVSLSVSASCAQRLSASTIPAHKRRDIGCVCF